MTVAERPLRVAIIGAGPSGLYAAEALLKSQTDVSIDVFDRLPTPYGLVRFGVAPDHQKIKAVTALYEKTCRDDRIRFFGNVEFGRDLTREDVRRHYDAAIYAVGAATDRSLNVPGEDLKGSLSATEFVAWYNGHPDYVDLDIKLDVDKVAVVGVGNVAVDVARILAKTADELHATDIADYALPVLAKSKVKEIYMLGRRGPAQAKFTTKELRDLGELANCDLIIDPAEVVLDPDSAASIEHDATAKRNFAILEQFAKREPSGKPRRLYLRFFASPVEILGQGKVEGLRIEKNRLEPTESGYLSAVGTGEYELLEVGMVLRSVGYRGVPLSDVPFDSRRSVIPNIEGRVLDAPGGHVLAGEYVTGWIKRGPIGVIGTNKGDAIETVKLLLEDASRLPSVHDKDADPAAVDDLLVQRGVRYVTFDDWLALDEFERECGKRQGRVRVKVTRIEEMLKHRRSDLVDAGAQHP